MGFIKEFKEFAVKGNAMDLAVGVIIGGAFSKLVSSLVNDILLPPISALAGNTDLSQLKVDLSAIRSTVSKAGESVTEAVASKLEAVDPDAVEKAETLYSTVTTTPAEPIYWCYGAFLQQCIDFIIIAFCVFLIVKLMNRISRKEKAGKVAPSKEEQLLTEIRDLLKARNGEHE